MCPSRPPEAVARCARPAHPDRALASPRRARSGRGLATGGTGGSGRGLAADGTGGSGRGLAADGTRRSDRGLATHRTRRSDRAPDTHRRACPDRASDTHQPAARMVRLPGTNVARRHQRCSLGTRSARPSCPRPVGCPGASPWPSALLCRPPRPAAWLPGAPPRRPPAPPLCRPGVPAQASRPAAPAPRCAACVRCHWPPAPLAVLPPPARPAVPHPAVPSPRRPRSAPCAALCCLRPLPLAAHATGRPAAACASGRPLTPQSPPGRPPVSSLVT